jgi:hypothetical protein
MPDGEILILVDQDTIPADGISTVQITTEPLYYNNETLVEDGELFTLDLSHGFVLNEDLDESMEGIQLAAQGGVVVMERSLLDSLIPLSRPWIYSTGIAPTSAAAAQGALAVIQRHPDKLSHLASMCQTFHLKLNAMLSQYHLPTIPERPYSTPIFPVILGNRTKPIADQLLEQGIFAYPVLSPTVPTGEERLRLSLSLSHQDNHLAQCLQALANCLQSA